MFTLNVNMPEMNATMFAQGTGVVADVEIWHKHIGHANVQRLKLMQSKELVTSLPQLRVSEMQQVCATCQLGKQAKGSFPQERHVSKNVLELIHSDVRGPAKNTSMGGCRFYVTFIDDCSRKCLRSNRGGEYFFHEFNNSLKKHRIKKQFSCRYTSQQNGVAEHKNRHIVEVARALMSEKNMPSCYWTETASTVVYTMNRTPIATGHDMTPKEKFTGKKSDVSHYKVFGCIAYVHVPDELRTKLDPKSLTRKLKKCVVIGYSI
ncbi:hypothetical protein L7F22_021069 [Adiantum nelumboides]|nr:hypothetical protein [Adiantum nelumboides]